MLFSHPKNINLLSPDANQEDSLAGAFDEERKKRRLRAMIKILLRDSSLSKIEKDDILENLNQFVLVELEKTKTRLQKEGQDEREDQQRVEKPSEPAGN
ncbi:MAG: hypothetical protein WCT46_06020 [Candidatus Gracilibacteria bacterium]|jgi:hypothetical protein